MNAWYEIPIGLVTIAQLLALLACGAVWAAAVWKGTEIVKDTLALAKPYSRGTRVRLLAYPLALSVLGVYLLMPGALELFGVRWSTGPGLGGFLTGCGVVAWALAKWWHDHLGGLWDLVVDRLKTK